MIISPYTSWDGDALHGRSRVLTPVWVRLDTLFPRPDGVPRRVIETGLDLTGAVPARLHGRFPSVDGDWCGVIDYEINYADGRRDQLQLKDQLVPFTALRQRD
ncbi:hypothetical protein V5P93_003940 [Actinokineospora auranticolor]|uniref:Uncharacterized protein n=1 Tax=Actinokineospora auranticolor TaxID=155976 RepID=A0A2S6GLW0_9PSEU|nr:hypothetical protein [Actinokineospora auranticolor]PPK66222.1 hypothetical protein CLV40_111186 [Actinokineospora auranticolor]